VCGLRCACCTFFVGERKKKKKKKGVKPQGKEGGIKLLYKFGTRVPEEKEKGREKISAEGGKGEWLTSLGSAKTFMKERKRKE